MSRETAKVNFTLKHVQTDNITDIMKRLCADERRKGRSKAKCKEGEKSIMAEKEAGNQRTCKIKVKCFKTITKKIK